MSEFPLYMQSRDVVEMVHRGHLLQLSAPWQKQAVRSSGKVLKDCFTENGLNGGFLMVNGWGKEVAPRAEVEKLMKEEEEEKARWKADIYKGHRMKIHDPEPFAVRDIADFQFQVGGLKEVDQVECTFDTYFDYHPSPILEPTSSVRMERIPSNESDHTLPPTTPELHSSSQATSTSKLDGKSKKRVREMEDGEQAAEGSTAPQAKKARAD